MDVRTLDQSDRIRLKLASLNPSGRALKVHILSKLAESLEPLTTGQIIAGGGPKRNWASTWYALRALKRVELAFMAPKETDDGHDRWYLKDEARPHVIEFLKNQVSSAVEQRDFMPLARGVEKLKAELAIVHAKPTEWFTVDLVMRKTRRCNSCTTRKHMMELFEHGYFLRRLSDPSKPGIPRYEFQMNPNAEAQARDLLT